MFVNDSQDRAEDVTVKNGDPVRVKETCPFKDLRGKTGLVTAFSAYKDSPAVARVNFDDDERGMGTHLDALHLAKEPSTPA